MMKKGDNMERNLDNLLPLVQKLCDDINELHIKEYPTLTEYNTYFEVARKYIKVITDSGNQKCVWGFINKSNPFVHYLNHENDSKQKIF